MNRRIEGQKNAEQMVFNAFLIMKMFRANFGQRGANAFDRNISAMKGTLVLRTLLNKRLGLERKVKALVHDFIAKAVPKRYLDNLSESFLSNVI